MSQPTRTPLASLVVDLRRNAGRPSLSRLAAPLALVLAMQASAVAMAAGIAAPLPVSTLAGPSVPLWGAVAVGAQGRDDQRANRIDGLTVEELEDGTTVLRVQGSRKPTFNVYRLSGPERLVVDIASSERGEVVPHVPLDTWACGRVTVDGVQERDTTLVRVVVELKREASYIVLPKGEQLVVTVTPRELAPEAYFARKSADERRAEIERSTRHAKALEAEARALSSHARQQAAEADRKVSEAASDAKQARAAEQRARAAEQRAAAAEAQARQALTDAKNGKLRLRRSLEEAQAVRGQAEHALEQAQVERTRAEATLAKARAKLDAEREQLAKARGQTEAERQELAKARGQTEAEREQLAKARGQTEAEREQLSKARGRVAQAEAAAQQVRTKAAAALAQAETLEAEAARKAKAQAQTQQRAEQEAAKKVAAAETLEADAKRKAEAIVAEAKAHAAAKVAAATADAKRKAEQELAAAEAEAERKLAQAQAQAERSAVQKAERALAQVRARSETEVAKHVAAAKARAQREAKADLAQARARAEGLEAAARSTLAAAERTLAEAEAEATRKQQVAAKAEAEATRKQQSAAAMEQQAKTVLARAEQELARAEAERRAAVSARTAEPAAAEPAAKRPAPRSDAPARAFVRDVRFEDGEGESRVIIEVDGPVRFEGRTLTPDIQLLAIEGARIDPRLERSLDARAYAGPVERITSFAEDGGAKIIVATRGAVAPRLEQGDGTLVWHFPHGSPGSKTKTGARAAEGAPAAVPAHELASLAGPKVGGFATSAPPLAAMMAPAPSSSRSLGPAASPDAPAPARSGTRWRGERIDIELQDAPIKDVLLLFSDIGRVNIIAGRNVEGSVTMKLTAVPWDQALDIILRSLNLGMVREGNVIRVATSEDLDNERRQAIEQANARVQLKPLETKLVPISYATVDEMIPKVQSVLSPRGTVTPDSRTNTLIIMDVAENIALAEQLVANLDTQTPQVLIEARIVEARTNFQRQLGIQWGFDFTASPGTGNPTGLLFPNSVGLGGGATGIPTDARGLVLPGSAANPNYVVDLPAPVGTGSGGALGFSFGSINGNLNTNLRLSQAEETGEVRIISAPKIVTLDNSEAQIEQGVQIPISQVSAQGVNTRFVNATLSLRVTPHVTNEGAVLLDVQVQKNEADFINTGARGDPTILTKQARSRMLVNDSDTAVIGGIYTRNKAVNFTKVPWLADIPIIGWFFKNKSEADTRSEVLIFLTPKIVNRASSIGG